MEKVFIYKITNNIIKANVINTINMCKGFLQNNCKVYYYVNKKNDVDYYKNIINNCNCEYVTNLKKKDILNFIIKNEIKIVYTRDDGTFIKYLLEQYDKCDGHDGHDGYDGYVVWEDHSENPPEFIKNYKHNKKLIFVSISPIITNNFNIDNNILFPCAIDFDVFSKKENFNCNIFDKNKINVTYCGHLYNYKGIPLVLEASKKFPNVNFNFIGGTVENINVYKEQIKNLPNVYFLGHKNYNEVPNYLYSSDVLLIPYNIKGNSFSQSYITSPIKLFEYLSTKKIVLCSDIKGITNWVSGNEVIFYKADSLDDFCEKLQYIFNNLNTNIFDTIKENGFMFANKYSTYNKCKSILDKIIELKKNKIVVTGCAGFIGSHTCEKLLQDGNIVIGIDNMHDYYDIEIKKNNIKILEKYENFKFYLEDIRTSDIINRVIPDKVCHLASVAGVRYSIENPNLYVDVNINGFVNILEQCRKNNVKQLVYASSSSVYGLNTKIPFNEDDSIKTLNSPYATSKLAMEMYASTYYQLYKLKSIGLRFFTVYGPRGRPDMAPYKFLKAIMSENRFQKYGNGTSSRDYTYIDDIVNGIISSLDNSKDLGCEIINLGNSSPVTLNEFIQLCEKVVGKSSLYDQLNDQLGDVPCTYADITKGNKLINYMPLTSLEDGLKKTYEYLKLCDK